MKIKVRRTDVFIPKWMDNEEQAEPIKVHYRFLTISERHKYQGVEPVEVGANGEPVIRVRQDNEGMARKMITRIENFVLDDGRETVIDDAAKLYNTPGVPPELVAMIEAEMVAASSEVKDGPLE